jgi:signal transduction histidine kinase
MRPFGGDTHQRSGAGLTAELAPPWPGPRPQAGSQPVVWLLAATAAVLGTGELADALGWTDAAALALVVVAQTAVGAAWLATARTTCQRDLEDGDAQVRAEVDLVLEASRREERERLHELRSTIAGLVNGSALLDNPALGDDTRRHLCESVHRELERMQRLLTGEHQSSADIDVDQALQMVLELQRLKGREVELHTDGGTVRARYDALAEAVNILMDNAATHGGCRSSRVDVVHRDGGTVDITVSDDGRGIAEEQRERIFEWGHRGADSRGQGIGLHVARRLMTEDGGSLRLAEARGPGSSFVISLPAPRCSTEGDTTDEDSHVAWRLSS